MDDNPRPSKRTRKSCERCRHRKQKCHGFPICKNCASAREECIQPPTAIEEYNSGPNQALLERISFLESQLATYTTASPSEKWEPSQPPFESRHVSTAGSVEGDGKRSDIPDIVGFLSLGGDAAYVGASSGFSMASSLGQMVQATVWNKALASTITNSQPKAFSIADLKRNSAGPPNEEMGKRIIDAYWTRVHLRYPFLDRKEMMAFHANRFTQSNQTPREQYGTFKLYMMYAIGATMLKLTEPYDYTPPENLFMTALQYISAAWESHSVHNIEAMTLLVLYNLRSASNSGIWYMIGLAMRTCVDLGLHRESHYGSVTPYEGQLRRRLFWTVYFLERVIAVSAGRPYSIADRDIDVSLPLEIDDTVRDNGLIARTLAISNSPTFQASRPSSNITLAIQCIRLKRLESRIQSTIYRVDIPISSLVVKIKPTLKLLEDWHRTLPPSTPYESDYLDMHYYKAIRLLLQPFLTILPPTSPHVSLCLHAAGQICQIFKRLHQRDSYGHSFIALHSVFIAGLTMCYCLFISPDFWTITVSNDLRACSSALFVMAERTPVVKKYRDSLETVIGATMEFLAKGTTNDKQQQDRENSSRTVNQSSHMSMPATAPSNATSPTFSGVVSQESFIRGPPASTPAAGASQPSEHHQEQQQQQFPSTPQNYNSDVFDFMPTPTMGGNVSGSVSGNVSGSPGAAGRYEGRQGEMGQMDAEWLLGLCEGDGFSLQVLNDMMRFEPSLGA